MESEPWYQTQGPSLSNVVEEHVAYYSGKTTCSKDDLRAIVTECARLEEQKFGGFGSFRGYATFVLIPLRKAIEKKLGHCTDAIKSPP